MTGNPDLFQVTCEKYKLLRSGSSLTSPVQRSPNSRPSGLVFGILTENAISSRSPSMLIQLENYGDIRNVEI